MLKIATHLITRIVLPFLLRAFKTPSVKRIIIDENAFLINLSNGSVWDSDLCYTIAYIKERRF